MRAKRVINIWTATEARKNLDALLDAATSEPQIISYRGKPKYEVRLFKAKSAGKTKPTSLYKLWASAPKMPEFKLPPRK